MPPDIINTDTSGDLSVSEGENATLWCKATGHPTPRIAWKREDGQSIVLRKGPREYGKGNIMACHFVNLLIAISVTVDIIRGLSCWCGLCPDIIYLMDVVYTIMSQNILKKYLYSKMKLWCKFIITTVLIFSATHQLKRIHCWKLNLLGINMRVNCSCFLMRKVVKWTVWSKLTVH